MLSDNPFVQQFFHVFKPLAFGFGKFAYGDFGPARHYVGNVVGRNRHCGFFLRRGVLKRARLYGAFRFRTFLLIFFRLRVLGASDALVHLFGVLRKLFGQFRNVRGFARHAHFGATHSLVDKVDSLVGQKPVGNIFVGQFCRGDNSLVRQLDFVIVFIILAQAFKNFHGLLDGRRLDCYRLKTPLHGFVRLDIFAVFVRRGRAYGLHFAASKIGF